VLDWKSNEKTFETNVDSTHRQDMYAVIRDTISLCNDTRNTLRRLVSERLAYEMKFPFLDEDESFAQTGGFIPCFWLVYGKKTQTCFKLSDFNKLATCNYPVVLYEKFYMRHKVEPRYQEIRQLLQRYLDGVGESPTAEANYIGQMTSFFFKVKGDGVGFGQALVRNPEGRTMNSHIFDEVNRTVAISKGLVDSENVSFRFEDPSTPPAPVKIRNPGEVAGVLKMAKQSSFTRSTPQNKGSSRTSDMYEITCTYQGKNKKVILIDLPGNEEQISDCTDETRTERCAETRGIYRLLQHVKRFIAVKRFGFEAEAGKRLLKIADPTNPLNMFFGRMLENKVAVSFLCFAAKYASSPSYMPNTKTTLQYVDSLYAAKLECDPSKKMAEATRLLRKMEAEKPAQPEQLTAAQQRALVKIKEVVDHRIEGLPAMKPKLVKTTVHVRTDNNGSYLVLEGFLVSESTPSASVFSKVVVLQDVEEIYYCKNGKSPLQPLSRLIPFFKLDVLKKSPTTLVPIEVSSLNSETTALIKTPVAIDFSLTEETALLPYFLTEGGHGVSAGAVYTKKTKASLKVVKSFCHIYLLEMKAFTDFKKSNPSCHYADFELRTILDALKSSIITVKTTGGSLTKKVKRRAAKSKTRSSK